MNNYGAHVWTIFMTILIATLGLMIWLWGYMDLNGTLASNNLQGATRTALTYACDESGRRDNGTYYINKSKFREALDNTRIKQFGDQELGASTNGSVGNFKSHTNDKIPAKVYYLKDNGGNNSTDSTDVDDGSANSERGYIPIRAVRVVVYYNNRPHYMNSHDIGDKDPNSRDKQIAHKANAKKYHMFSATETLQTNDKGTTTTTDKTQVAKEVKDGKNAHFNDLSAND